MKKFFVCLLISLCLLFSFSVFSFAADEDDDLITSGESVVSTGVYYDIYDIFTSFVYGDVELQPEHRLTATILSTLLCVVVFCIPFIIGLWIIKFLFSWRF